jgi:oxalate decarboxylase/phosphoglucose isomerase-like protein (cupin superfamily)
VRGWSFPVAAPALATLSEVKDMHVASIMPGHIRGNHFHAERKEVIVVVFEDRWSLYWDSGSGTDVISRSFDGCGAVAITVPHDCAHAIRNDGGAPLVMVAFTDGPYDADHPDAHRRVVAEA